MKRDKATLVLGGAALVERTYNVARKVFDSIVIVSGRHDSLNGIEAPIIRDILPVRSSMVGIVSALLQADTPYLFVLACDMPFVTEETIRAVVDAIGGEDIIVPKTDKGFEPLHAAYNKSCISHMLRAIRLGWPKITDLFPYVSVKVVENHPSFTTASGSIFMNVNTEEDLALAEQRVLMNPSRAPGEGQ
jgi:molybdopterin-guanine dinucleotide biosynthesis protein A